LETATRRFTRFDHPEFECAVRRLAPFIAVLLIARIASVGRAETPPAPLPPEAREKAIVAIPERLLRAVGPEKIITLQRLRRRRSAARTTS
jgi:hypothetical protein